MKIKSVKSLEDVEQKSTQEVEKELLEKHEAQFEDSKPEETVVAATEETTPAVEEQLPTFKEEDVLTYIGERYGKPINSLDEFFEKRETSEELPEDVAAFFKYKKETGRSLEDYMKLNKDYSQVNPDTILANYYEHTEEGLDSDDINAMVNEFSYDEDLDDEDFIRKQKLAKKREVAKATKYFKEMQEQYSAPLESRSDSSSSISDEELDAYKTYLKESKSLEEEKAKRSEWFLNKTNELFNNDFKGFNFELDGKQVTYSPRATDELKSSQSSIVNFIEQYVNKDGLMENINEYHRSLAMAMNPDKFAKFFYEQGKADAVESDAKKAKNIDMSLRRTPETTNKGGLSIKAVSSSSNNNGLKIRSRRK